MKLIALQPLAGGMAIGASRVFGKLPDIVLASRKCEKNEKHYKNYLLEHNWNGYWEYSDIYPLDKMKNVDLVVSIPFCKGISLASKTHSQDHPANNNMLEIAQKVLGEIKPEVYIFENSPNFATFKGEYFRNKIRKIATDNGYNMCVFVTKSEFHGNPQIRRRSYIIIRKKGIPNSLLKVPFKTPKRFEDWILDLEPLDDFESKNLACTYKPSSTDMYKLLVLVTGKNSHRKLCKMADENGQESIFNIILKTLGGKSEKNLSHMIELAQENNLPKAISFCTFARGKFLAGKNIWDHLLSFVRGRSEAFIQNYPDVVMHPYEDRFLSIRELLRLMDMPDDYHFNIKLYPKEKTYVFPLLPISQNVSPVVAENVIRAAFTPEKHYSDFFIQYHEGKILESDKKEITLENFC